jgi:hypothetical protein
VIVLDMHFYCKWYNVVTIWLQTLLLYWFYIIFMLSVFWIFVVLIFFQHHICIAHALLNVRDAMLQQHSYKLDIQYWLNVLFLLLMLLYICYTHTFPTLYLYYFCVVEGRWCNVATTQLQIGYSIMNQCCIHVYLRCCKCVIGTLQQKHLEIAYAPLVTKDLISQHVYKTLYWYCFNKW